MVAERYTHDVSLVYSRNFLSTICPCILKCKLSNTSWSILGNQLYALDYTIDYLHRTHSQNKHNSRISSWILIILTLSGNGNECPLDVSYLLIYFTCDVNMTSPSHSWHWWAAFSICCICGEAWSNLWLMTQLTNGQHTYVLVFVPTVDILNIPCDCQFVFSVLDELCVSNHTWCSG